MEVHGLHVAGQARALPPAVRHQSNSLAAQHPRLRRTSIEAMGFAIGQDHEIYSLLIAMSIVFSLTLHPQIVHRFHELQLWEGKRVA